MKSGSLSERELNQAQRTTVSARYAKAKSQDHAIAEQICWVRCPCCRYVLIACMGPNGPGFRCRCDVNVLNG